MRKAGDLNFRHSFVRGLAREAYLLQGVVLYCTTTPPFSEQTTAAAIAAAAAANVRWSLHSATNSGRRALMVIWENLLN